MRTAYFASGDGDSQPNDIVAGLPGEFTDETYVDFPAGARNLTFRAGGLQTTGQFAVAVVHSDGATVRVPLLGNGQISAIMSLQHGTVRRLELTSITDASGVAWDDFAFDTAP